MPLKYLNNFWGTLEMPLINYKINQALTRSSELYHYLFNRRREFEISDKKNYVPGVTLSTQDNKKVLEHLNSGFEKTIKWNKYQSRVSM